MIFEQTSEAGIFQEHSNLKSEESRMDSEENSEILQKISSNDLCGSGSMNCKSNINNNPQEDSNNNNNTKISNILGNISNNDILGLSFLSKISYASLDQSDSFLNIIDEINKQEILQCIVNGFIPFFISLKGYKHQFILAKKEVKFNNVLGQIKKELNIEGENLGDFFQKNNLIDKNKTIEELEIKPFDFTISNYF